MNSVRSTGCLGELRRASSTDASRVEGYPVPEEERRSRGEWEAAIPNEINGSSGTIRSRVKPHVTVTRAQSVPFTDRECAHYTTPLRFCQTKSNASHFKCI